MNAVANFEPGQIHDDVVGNCARAAHDLDLITDNVQNAAALQARRFFFVREDDRNFDIDPGGIGHAQKVCMHRLIGYRMQLQVTAKHLLLVPIQRNVEQRGKEAGLHTCGAQLARIDGDGFGVLVCAINHCRNSTVSTCCTGGPLAYQCARFRIKNNGIGHILLLKPGDASKGATTGAVQFGTECAELN